MSARFVLGVDAGNSKTVALVVRGCGTVLGWGRGGGGDIYAGESAACTELAHAVSGALHMAGLSLGRVQAACLSMVGADWPEDFAFWRAEAAKRAYAKRVLVVNDALGALRAGARDGVSVVCGTGAAIGARLGERVWHSSFWQEPLGGYALGERVLWAVYRADLGIDPPTQLTERVLEHSAKGVPKRSFTASPRARACRGCCSTRRMRATLPP